jgi:transposase
VTVPARTEAEIRRLHFAEHWPVGTIASQLGVHEDVVRRVLGLLQPRRSPLLRPTLVAPYADFINETLALYPRLRATRLYDMARDRGYAGSVRTLREFIAGVRPVPKQEAYLRLEPLIGEQAQIDWAHVAQVPVQGGQRSLWLFVMVLSWSRALWGEFVFDLSVHSLLRSLSRACAFFGGSTRQWLFDNPKTVVLERYGEAVRYHPLLVDLGSRYCAQLRVCAVRKANQKGRVERAIRYLRDRFLAGRTIAGVDQGNAALLSFLREIALPRPHPSLPGRSVADCFAEERARLLPVPDAAVPTDLVQSVLVDKTAFLRFDRNAYSVPPAYAAKTLTLVADDRELRILDGDKEVARHQRSFGRQQLCEQPAHREELLRLKRKAREHRGHDHLLAVAPAIESLLSAWVLTGRNISSLTAQTSRLLDLYGPELFRLAVDELVVRGVSDPGALAQVCEQHRHAQARLVPVPLDLGPNVPDRDITPHPLEGYDEKLRRRD